MTATRNTVFATLFALTANMEVGHTIPVPAFTPFKSRSRKFRHFSKVDPKQQPAFFQTEHSEQAAELTNMPPFRKWTAWWTVFISSNQDDLNIAATVYLNDYLDAFDARLRPAPGQSKQTLGGLVHHAFIDGSILKVPGDDDGQGMLAVPITILVP